MALIEKGDYFVVTRGFKLGDADTVMRGLFGMAEPKGTSDEPRYDRSHEGRVYQAIEVCGNVIAAKLVFGPKRYAESGVLSINTTEIEVWPVTPQYVAALTNDTLLPH